MTKQGPAHKTKTPWLRWLGIATALLTVANPPALGQTPPASDDARLQDILTSRDGKYPRAPAIEFQKRGGLPNVFAKLAWGETVTVAYFGTSVTHPPGWRTMTFDWLQKQYPEAKLTMLDASVGGTGSLVGAFRADADLVAFKPDLVFIEFAGNDNGDATRQPKDVLRAMEGIVRKLRRSEPDTDICLAYAFGGGDFQTLRAGSTPPGGTLHELIADYYGLPSIQMSLEVAKMEQEGTLVNAAPMTPTGRTPDGKIIFTTDGSHPTIPLGHAIWAGVVERALQQMRQAPSVPHPHKLPPPLLPDNWESARTVPVGGNAQFSGAWEKLTAASGPAVGVEGKSVYAMIPFLYRTSTPGASVTVRFRGAFVGLKGVTGPDSGVIGIQVDGQPMQKETQFTVYSKNFSYGGRPLPEMSDGTHTVTWTFLGETPDKQKILASYPRPGNDRDFRDHPEKYAGNTFSVGQILLDGEILGTQNLKGTQTP